MEISIETNVDAPIEYVWTAWTNPEHITRWNFASEDWQCPHAHNDLTIGGRFNYRMEAKDGIEGFDFEGTFTVVEPGKRLEYIMDDNRKVIVTFEKVKTGVRVIETFQAENEMTEDQQRQGWQSILDNFKKYVET